MALPTHTITGDLLDASGNALTFGTVTFVPAATHDARVDGTDALLGFIVRDIKGLGPVTLTAGGWTITVATRTQRSTGTTQRPAFTAISRQLDMDRDYTWGEIVAGAVTNVPVDPTVLTQAAAYAAAADADRAAAEAAAASVQREQPGGVAGLDGSGKVFETRIPDRLSAATLKATLVPKWAATTDYAANDPVVAPNGDVVYARSNHNSGATYNPKLWAPMPAVTRVGARERNAVRRAGAGRRPTLFALPAGLGWAAPIRIFKDGRRFITDFDVAAFKNTGGATWHVHTGTGNDTTGTGAVGAPYRSLLKAYQSAAAGDTIRVQDAAGTVVHRPYSWNAQRIRKSLNLIADFPIYVAYADALTYSLVAGETRVFTAARTNVRTVVDLTVGTYGYRYTNVANRAACAATPGSWWQNGSNIEVNPLTGTTPDNTKILALLAGEHFYADSNDATVNLYMENITVLGGNTGNLTIDKTNNPIRVYGKRSRFLWSTGTSGMVNSVNIAGADVAYFEDCVAAYSQKDGFNYTAYNVAGVLKTAPKFIEDDCESFGHGLDNAIAGAENTNNGSTAHEGAVGVRIGGDYHDTMGAVVADVQTATKSVNLSCRMYDPASTTGDGLQAAVAAQQSGAEMWLYDCQVFGAAIDVYAVTGTTVHIIDTEYDTYEGNGTFDVVSVA